MMIRNLAVRLTLVVVLFSGCFATPAALRATNAADLADKRVLMLGDSITQNGLYVTFLEYYLHRLAPGGGYDIISIGLSSETVSGLSEPGVRFPRPNALDRLAARVLDLR